MTRDDLNASVQKAFRLIEAETKFVRDALVPCALCERAKLDHVPKTMKCPYAPSTFSAMPGHQYLIVHTPDGYKVTRARTIPERVLYTFTSASLMPYRYAP